MRPIRTVPSKDEREYPLVITAEEKDKVLNYILVVANGKRTAKLNIYKSLSTVNPPFSAKLNISKFNVRYSIQYHL